MVSNSKQFNEKNGRSFDELVIFVYTLLISLDFVYQF